MNNDNDLNLHSMTKLSGWLRYCQLNYFCSVIIQKIESITMCIAHIIIYTSCSLSL